jgi:DNA-binding transcriptional ArsR family regulator
MDAVAHALADPIRREILRMLREQGETAGAIANAFPVSRPAVSRHLRVLREAGLVSEQSYGREREYRLDLAPLAELEAYLRNLRTAPDSWERRFDALETEIQRVRRRRRNAPTTTGDAGEPASAKTQEKV